jgi:PleD family two-component response regulator
VEVVAEKLRRTVEEMPPIEGGMASGPTHLTLSLGGASLRPDVVDERLLISCADRALYEAKRNGRNQVRLWSDPLPPEPRRAASERRSA